ncbi:hypothetical protein [Spiroplasma endosymbiont of Dilophus febrilis]
MLFFQNYSNLYPPNKTLCAQLKTKIQLGVVNRQLDKLVQLTQ